MRTIRPGCERAEQRRVTGQDAELALAVRAKTAVASPDQIGRSTETSSTCIVAISDHAFLSSCALRSRSSMPPHMKNACSG